MKLDSKIYIAGHRGLVSSALIRQLKKRGYNNLLLRTHAELELRNFVNAADKELLIVAVDPRYFRPTEVETLLGDASKARIKLGWTPNQFRRAGSRNGA